MKPAWLAMIVAAFGAAGCLQPGHISRDVPPRPVNQIDQITLLSRTPVALNLDGRGGTDGLRMQVYLFQLARQEPVTVDGTLEFMAYPGRVGPTEVQNAQPFHTWSFASHELPQYLAHSVVGWGYGMELRWGRQGPRGGMMTIVARYRPSGGEWVYSAPLSISAGQEQAK